MHWFLDPIQNHYADFEGRIGRQEFWMFVLFVFGINIVLSVLHLDVIGVLVSLALLVPNLAIGARRLHDIGRSGWWQLLCFIPIVGLIILIVWLATDTVQADNQYGSPARSKVVGDVPQAAAAVGAVASVDEVDQATVPPQSIDSASVVQTEDIPTDSSESRS